MCSNLVSVLNNCMGVLCWELGKCEGVLGQMCCNFVLELGWCAAVLCSGVHLPNAHINSRTFGKTATLSSNCRTFQYVAAKMSTQDEEQQSWNGNYLEKEPQLREHTKQPNERERLIKTHGQDLTILTILLFTFFLTLYVHIFSRTDSGDRDSGLSYRCTTVRWFLYFLRINVSSKDR